MENQGNLREFAKLILEICKGNSEWIVAMADLIKVGHYKTTKVM